MGARQSKRSVDITTTPKKGDSEATPVNEDKIEKLGDADVEVVTNGTAAHTDIEFADKDEAKESEEKVPAEVKENGLVETSDGEKTPDTEAAAPAAGDQPTKTPDTTAEKSSENGEKAAETPDSKKPKDKKKKKWSLRSISFSKKDKSKPSKDKEKNGEVEGVDEEKEEENASKPTTETVNTETKHSEEAEQTDVTNTNTQELTVKTTETEKPDTNEKTEEPKSSENPSDAAAPEAVNEKDKQEPVVLETTTECVKSSEEIEETTTAPSVVEDVKEVRNEEIPPPLPNSNPPSQVAVFAESLKDDTLALNENSSVSESHLEQKQTVLEPPQDESNKLIESQATIDEASVKVESDKISPIEVPDDVKSSVETDTTIVETLPQAEKPLIEESQIESLHINPPETESKNDSLVEVSKISDINSAEKTKISENEPSLSENMSSISSNSKQENGIETCELINTEISSGGDSSPLIVEALPKLEDTNHSSELISENSSHINLSDQPSETSNLAETGFQEITNLEFEGIPLKIEYQESDSLSSVPTMIEEKIPIVSSAGDVPNPLSSETSLDYKDETLPESKSNLNLKDTPNSQESNLNSEEQSLDLSTIPEVVESSEIKLLEENSNILSESSPSIVNDDIISNEVIHQVSESQLNERDSINIESIPSLPQKEVEPLCNADSLADLSTESLPSLPEPTDSVLEPMSLPPLDSVPDPLVDDNIPTESNDEFSLVTKPNETEHEVILTNGNATNGLNSSPTAVNDDSPLSPPLDGPLKQVTAVESSVGACEISQPTEGIADAVQSEQSEAQ